MIILIGDGYNQSVESDILLLDISNNDEYVWTNNFQPPPLLSPLPSQSPQSPPSQLPQSPQSPTTTSVPSLSSNKSAMIGTAIGSLISGFLLAFICFLLYKRYKHKQRQKNSIPTPGSVRNYQGQGQKILQIPGDNNEQKVIPIVNNNNEKLSLKNINDDVLQHLKNEIKQEIMQNLRQEILENNEQASSSKY